MIASARESLSTDSRCRLFLANEDLPVADYSVASGIFNVRLDYPEGEWRDHVIETLRLMHRKSTKGFAFNVLTGYSDPDRREARLYYADPCLFFDLCKREFSRNVALLHDYGLFEFTLLVRQDAPR